MKVVVVVIVNGEASKLGLWGGGLGAEAGREDGFNEERTVTGWAARCKTSILV